MPLFDQDLESASGMPEQTARLKQLMIDHDGLLLACPEYNSSITAVLKNAIDWTSRGQPNLEAYRGKAAALLSASPGSLGGLRGLVHVRAILGNIGVLVLPDQLAISKAHEAFHDDGNLKDARQHAAAEAIGESLARLLAKLKA
jgi:chromate reductase